MALVVLMTGCTKTDDRRAEPKAAAGKSANPPKQHLTADVLSLGISFSTGQLPSYVKRFYGVGQAEPFGRWTTGKLAFVELDGTLPQKFDLEVVAGAFGPNVGSKAYAIVGAEVREFRVTTEINLAKRYVMEFDGITEEDMIALEIAAPTSPLELGKGNDPRKLGLALVSLKIIPKP